MLPIFVVLQVKESPLLLGGCDWLSGLVMRETRLCFVGSVKLGGCLVIWGNRIFLGSLFNFQYINALWNTISVKW